MTLGKTYHELVIESTIAIVDTKMKQLDTEYNKLLMEHERNLNLIELKVLTENGSYDDLETLYTIEAEETNVKSKGIISRIIDVIIGFFRKIRTFIFGEKKVSNDEDNNQPTVDDIPDNIDITVEEDPQKVEQQTTSVLSAIRSFLAGNKKPLEEFAGGKSNVTLATGAVVVGSIILKRTLKKFEKMSKSAEKELNDAKKKSENMDSKDQGILKKGLDILNGCVKKMGNIAKSGLSKVRTGESDPDSRAAQIKMRIKQLEKLGNKRSSDGDQELESLKNELEQIERSRKNKKDNESSETKSDNQDESKKSDVDYSMFRNKDDVKNENDLLNLFKKHTKSPHKQNCLFCFKDKVNKDPHVWKLDKNNKDSLNKTINSIKKSIERYDYIGTLEFKNGKWVKTPYKPF